MIQKNASKSKEVKIIFLALIIFFSLTTFYSLYKYIIKQIPLDLFLFIFGIGVILLIFKSLYELNLKEKDIMQSILKVQDVTITDSPEERNTFFVGYKFKESQTSLHIDLYCLDEKDFLKNEPALLIQFKTKNRIIKREDIVPKKFIENQNYTEGE